MTRRPLNANRGEIGCRIILSGRDPGLECVAVCTDADEKAMHTTMADQAVHIGRSRATESYRNIETIVHAARRSGCDAEYPGDGFLAERRHLPGAWLITRNSKPVESRQPSWTRIETR